LETAAKGKGEEGKDKPATVYVIEKSLIGVSVPERIQEKTETEVEL